MSDKQTNQQTDFANQLITKQAAIDAIQQHREDVLGGYEYDEGVAFVYAAAHNHIIGVIKQLPSAQPTQNNTPNALISLDCVDRQAAFDWLTNEWDGMVTSVFDGIKNLPSVQETHDKRTETHACDLISRQAAIDALLDDLSYYGARNEAPYGMSRAIGIIKKLSSAQTKRIKGRWLKKESVGRWDDTLWECSECGCLHSDNVFCISGDFNFCPNCGAEMETEGGRG